jgi:hypothetical protein
MSDCLYFTRFTVDSEGSYYPSCPALVERFLASAGEVPEIAALADEFHGLLGVDLFAEVRRGPRSEDPFLSKSVQGVFFLALAHFLGRFHPRPIGAVGFYSAGVIPAYIFSGVFPFRQYLTDVSAFVNAYYMHRDREGRTHELSQALLRGAYEDDVLSFVARFIEDAHLGDQVFVKDRRQEHLILVAGLTPAVTAVCSAAARAIPAIARHGAKLQRVNAAHLPLVDRGLVLPLLDGVRFRPPSYTVMGTCGQVVPAGCEDEATLQSVFVEAVLGSMNTGESIERIAGACDRLIAIGSEHGLRVFEGIAPGALPPMVIASEGLLREATT